MSLKLMSLSFHVPLIDVPGVPQLDVTFNLCPYISCPLTNSMPLKFMPLSFNVPIFDVLQIDVTQINVSFNLCPNISCPLTKSVSIYIPISHVP